ncbi:MAG: methionine--tRNA ligase [bacterium]|nr:methionine--tRNA ligase [bacterium]
MKKQSEKRGGVLENKIFIGVALPYVNGEIHVGHLAGYLLPADIFARYSRLVGKDVLMVSGSDCFGTPITVEADKRGLTPKEIEDEYHKKDVHLFKDILGLTYDIYTKTDTENHIKVAQDFFIELLNKGYIYVDTTKQYYSPQEKRFLPDRYVEGTCKNCGYSEARSDQCDHCGKVLVEGDLENPVSKLTRKTVELKDTMHYFLDWRKLQPGIEEYVKEKGPGWKNWVNQETLGWLRQGLKPRAITRDIDWGIPIPVDRMSKEMVIENIDHKRLYVWFEAVIGYFSASKLWAEETGGKWEDFWKNPDARHFYFMGKDNLPFHTMFWPGELMAYDSRLHLPDMQSINMFLDFDGKQFSKSRGISIPAKDIVKQFGNDPVRFYLTAIMPEVNDSSFNWDDFKSKNNKVLLGNLGNFIHRTLSLGLGIEKKELFRNELLEITKNEIDLVFDKSRHYLDNCEFKNYLNSILRLSDYANKYMDREKIWELKKEEPKKFKEVLKQLYCIILSLGILMGPLLPDSSKKVFGLLGLEYDSKWPESGKETEYIKNLIVGADTQIKPTPLFKKIEQTEF